MTKLKHATRAAKRSLHLQTPGQSSSAALNAGTSKLVLFAGLIALAFGALVYYQFISSKLRERRLKRTLRKKRNRTRIARMVQKPNHSFLISSETDDNYRTARELLPGETEVSNVLAAIQQMARANQVASQCLTLPNRRKSKRRRARHDRSQYHSKRSAIRSALNERVMPAQYRAPTQM